MILKRHIKKVDLKILLISLVFIGSAWSAFSNHREQYSGKLIINIVDSLTGKPTPVRVRITHKGFVIKKLPKEAISVMYGLWDHADGFGFQPDSSFYVKGRFQLELPQGEYELFLSKGLEYVDQRHTVFLEAGKDYVGEYKMIRWINMPTRGWYSADAHIHIRRSPHEDSTLVKWIEAENINVGVLLRMGDFWSTYYEQYGWGKEGTYQQDKYILTSGQEDPRTPELGHALGIGASNKVRYAKDYYYYDKVFDQLHVLGGLTGYAHHAESFKGYRGLMLDGLRNKVDMVELLQFCVAEHPLHTKHYYHLLDLGYPITAIAGSDFPWCGKDHDGGQPEKSARIGNVRFYTYLDSVLTMQRWKDALHKGRTFVTSGPILDFRVNGFFPGEKLNVKKGTLLTISVHAYGHVQQVPVQKLEIVSHGKVIDSVYANEPGQSSSHLFIEKKIVVDKGFWIAARSYGDAHQAAHTTPVYVSVDKSGFHNSEMLAHYLKLSKAYLKELKQDAKKVHQNPEYQLWRYRKGIEKRIEEVERIIEQLRRNRK